MYRQGRFTPENQNQTILNQRERSGSIEEFVNRISTTVYAWFLFTLFTCDPG